MNNLYLKIISLSALCVFSQILSAKTITTKITKSPQITTLFDQTRSDKDDIIYFRNNDVLRGKIINETISIATQYGKLEIPLRSCAGISFDGTVTNTETVITVNFNRITGIITDRIINFMDGSSGAKIPIRKEKIRFLLLRKTPFELDFLKDYEKSDLFIMTNGDVLSGESVERDVEIRTIYSEIPVSFSEIKNVVMQGGDNLNAVITKTNGETIRGMLKTEEFSLKLEIGLELPAIYTGKFAKIFVDEAHEQAPALLGIKQPIFGESEGAQSFAYLTSNRIITLDMGKNVTMNFVQIPAGKFLMGSSNNEVGHRKDEEPLREVTISQPFYMGVYEVTQEQYEAVMGSNLSLFRGATKPVDSVSWDDATAFCKKLSQKTGKIIKLPTEAQWEYACRAGSITRFYFGEDDTSLQDYAWYDKNSEKSTHQVGQKKPNAFGIYDISGNVWEWCADWYSDSYENASTIDPSGPVHGEYRVLRGGDWFDDTMYCRSAFRIWLLPVCRYFNCGFRVVMLFD
jgi:formylglycine-generating enzyme required for sulfatase activity